jgi:integrase
MPKIKTKRQDILRKKEILDTLTKAAEVGAWLQALIALAWAFGKRINEILRLQAEDFRTDDKFLYVRFFVSKKKTRQDQAVPKPYLKRITLSHPSIPYILAYLKETKEGPLFHVSRNLAWYYLKKVNKQAWWHLFRESLATEMAEHGASEEMLMHWFDWDRLDTAHSYVKRGTKLTEELSERTW